MGKQTTQFLRTAWAFGLIAISCSDPEKPQRTAFMGHTIGENSMAWGSEELVDEPDPLSKCQEIVRSPVVEQSTDSARQCQDFVNHGNYSITLRNPNTQRERLFRFSGWTLSLLVVQFGHEERSRVVVELNSHFKNVVPNSVWHGKDGAVIEIRPAEQLPPFTGKPTNSDGFIVAVSVANP
jgi:hypothetical protein